VAYLESVYDPPQSYGDARVCNNFLGDSGVGGLGTYVNDTSYSFTVPAQKDFVVVFNTADPNTTCTSFSATLTGLVDDTPGPGACPPCTPPAKPTITPAGPTTFCTSGNVTLNSSAASGNQWYWNGAAINGATDTSLIVGAAGSYTVTTTANGCISAPVTPVAVTVNPVPAAPAPANGGPFCAGSSITLTAPAIANATYAWTGPNGFTSALQNPTRANATAADAGTY